MASAREAWGGVVGGILLLPRIAFNAAVFESVTTSLSAMEAITHGHAERQSFCNRLRLHVFLFGWG